MSSMFSRVMEMSFKWIFFIQRSKQRIYQEEPRVFPIYTLHDMLLRPRSFQVSTQFTNLTYRITLQVLFLARRCAPHIGVYYMSIVALTSSPRLIILYTIHVFLTTLFVPQAAVEINLGFYPKIGVSDSTYVRFFVGC